MPMNKPHFVVVRILDTTRTRLRIKAAQKGKKLYQIIDELVKV